jgi:hypothetical protein
VLRDFERLSQDVLRLSGDLLSLLEPFRIAASPKTECLPRGKALHGFYLPRVRAFGRRRRDRGRIWHAEKAAPYVHPKMAPRGRCTVFTFRACARGDFTQLIESQRHSG